MIGWVIGGIAAVATIGVARSLMARSAPKPINAPSLGPTVPGTGGSVALAVPADEVLDVSPMRWPLPVVGQQVALSAKDPLDPGISDPEAIPVMAVVQAISSSDDRIVAMLTPPEIEKLINEVPVAASRISPAARASGFYASFSGDRVWGLGPIVAVASAPSMLPTSTVSPLAPSSPSPGGNWFSTGRVGYMKSDPSRWVEEVQRDTDGMTMCYAWPPIGQAGPPTPINCADAILNALS